MVAPALVNAAAALDSFLSIRGNSMCNYSYTVPDTNRRDSGEKRCPYPEFYERVRHESSAAPAASRSQVLPIDDSGACIFHSRDTVWKRENEFAGRFLELIQLLDGAGGKYDFAEFVFVGAVRLTKRGTEEHALHLSDITFPKDVNFLGATFADTLELDAVTFRGDALFRRSTFLQDLKVANSRVNSLDFIRATLQGLVYFSDVECLNAVLMDHARFTSTADDRVVKFDNVQFGGMVDFSDVSFTLGAESSVGFLNVKFADVADFTNVLFRCHVEFRKVTFASAAEFINTSFDSLGSSARHRGGAVNFIHINVTTAGVLTFMSTDPNAKMFNHDVTIRLAEEFSGVVRFENVNFNRISVECRKELIKLAKSGCVEIGAGCIKYRFQTGVRTIFVDQGNAPLVLELCQTFTHYFTASNGLNLGFEVVERDRSKVSFFYFTDEDISEVEFLERLAQTERGLWNLLSNTSGESRLAVEQSSGATLSTGGKRAVINAVDGVSAVMGTLFRAGARIMVGAWKESDTRALLGAIRFNDEGSEERAHSLHQALVDRYTGQTLFGFSHQQNHLLPPMADEGGKRLESAKVTILFLGANSSRSPMELEKEVSKIQGNLKLARERDNLVLKQEWAVTVDSLMQALLDESPTIVHFAGHGTESGIILQDESKGHRVVSADALSDLFKLFKDTVRCVVLNSCYSEHQAHAIRQHIPYVIGMRASILDSAAIAFSTGFYKAIGAGRDVPFAFDTGEACIKLAGFEGENIPILI